MNNIKKSIVVQKAVILCCALVCILMVNTLVFSQEITSVSNKIKPEVKLIEADVQFITEAAQRNTEGIRLAKLAQAKGSEAHVIELGKGLEEYHQKSLNALTTLAKLRNFSLDEINTTESNEAYALLNEKSGSDFNKSYADLTVDRLRDSVVAFENASARSNDLDIRTWSTTEIPPMREQLTKSIACQQLCNKM